MIPFIKSVGVTINELPLHITAVMVLITAFGLTVTKTVNDAPTQSPSVAVGVTV